MVVTRPGAAGVCVASHVTEELRLALVHAPIPRQHTEDDIDPVPVPLLHTVEKTVVDWELLQNGECVIHSDAHVRIFYSSFYYVNFIL